MVKKLVFLALITFGVGVAGTVVMSTGVGSYVTTAAGIVKEKVHGSIPLEFEIKRAEGLIGDIVPEIRACKRVVAEEEVAVEYLREEIVALTSLQSDNRSKIDVQRAALERSEPHYFFGGRRYTRVDLENHLEHSFDEFRSNDSLLESKARLLDAREQSLEAAKAKLERVRLEKSRLEGQVQNLYAQLRQVEAMESHTERFTFDESKLAQAKKLLDRCRKSLDVAQRMIENDREFADGFVVIEDTEDRDILGEVNRYFANFEPEPKSGTSSSDSDRLAVAGSDF